MKPTKNKARNLLMKRYKLHLLSWMHCTVCINISDLDKKNTGGERAARKMCMRLRVITFILCTAIV